MGALQPSQLSAAITASNLRHPVDSSSCHTALSSSCMFGIISAASAVLRCHLASALSSMQCCWW
jgi:hypothetical protein